MSFRAVLQGKSKPAPLELVAVKYLKRVTDKYGPVDYRETQRSGQAGNRNGVVFIKAPAPRDAAHLYVLLHEIAHVVLGHTDVHKDMPYNRAEFEAERQAQKWMDAEGLYVPRWVRQDARRSVRVAINQDRRAGESIDGEAERFSNEKVAK